MLSNLKLRQTITEVRVSAHKFPIETRQYKKKNPTKRSLPLCCEDIGDECH